MNSDRNVLIIGDVRIHKKMRNIEMKKSIFMEPDAEMNILEELGSKTLTAIHLTDCSKKFIRDSSLREYNRLLKKGGKVFITDFETCAENKGKVLLLLVEKMGFDIKAIKYTEYNQRIPGHTNSYVLVCTKCRKAVSL